MIEIERTMYLNAIQRYANAPAAVVVTGLRRVGKSVLLRQLCKEMEPSERVIYIDKESLEFDHVQTATDIVTYCNNTVPKGEKRNIIIDEIQQVQSWERAVASFVSEGNTRIIIAGSNSSLLSGDLATLISGSYVSVQVFPLSLSEFCDLFAMIHKRKEEPKEAFQRYIRYGGLPGLLHTDLSDDVIRQMQADIFNTIAVRDIITRYRIRDVRLFESILTFTMENIGNLLSAKSISDFLKKDRRTLSVDSVLNYLRYMEDAFLLQEAQRFDIKGKRYLRINPKYYLGDIGLRNGLIGYHDRDISSILENLVYIELCRRGYRISIGAINGTEIDFIAITDKTRLYIQVAYLLETAETINRELAPLKHINDAYPKILITLDEFQPKDFEGIHHVSLLDFLFGSPLPGK
jgi:predicted AAA+ superfamily ATPase